MTHTKALMSLALVAVMATSPFLAAAQGNGNNGNDDRGHSGWKFNSELKGEGRFNFGGLNSVHLKDSNKDDRDKKKHDDKKSFKSDARANVKSDANLDERIEARIDALVALRDRVEDSTRLSAAERAEISAAIAVQIQSLRNMLDRLNDGEAAAEVKADLKAAVKSFKGTIHAMPKAAISTASDRVIRIVDRLETLAVNLDARIDSARADGENMAVAEDAHADFVAHIEDADASARGAASLIANLNLSTDNASVIEANRQKLIDAKEMINDAYASLKEARAELSILLGELDVTLNANLEIRD